MKTIETPPDDTKKLSISEKVILATATIGLVAIGALMVASAPPV